MSINRYSIEDIFSNFVYFLFKSRYVLNLIPAGLIAFLIDIHKIEINVKHL